MTIFEKIIARQIPAKIIWEDDEAIAFHDVNPQAPVHVLIVPKRVVPRLTDATESDRALLGKLLLVASDLANKLDLSSGYRVVINSGPDAGESVPHLHVHLLAKRALAWPPGYVEIYPATRAERNSPRGGECPLLTNTRPVNSDDSLVRKAFQRFRKNEISRAFSFFEACNSKICPAFALPHCHYPIVLYL